MSSSSDLFDSIIDQLLSGVRRDGIRISFGYKTDNDATYSTYQMRRNFIALFQLHKVALCVDRGQTRDTDDDYDVAIDELTGSIPIFRTCISVVDFEYFEKEIVDYALAHKQE